MVLEETTVMATERDSPEAYLQSLRTQLKQWESKFALENGRKAERDDIKIDLTIALKYKEYSKLRSGRENRAVFSQPASSPSQNSKKRHRSKGEHDGGCKKQKQNPLHPSEIDPYDAPINATPSAVRTFVGPTPQKNGQVLGLFDLLSPSNAIDTPSKSGRATRLTKSAQSTPSKARTLFETDSLIATPSKNSRATEISEREYNLTGFLTPSTQRFISKETPKVKAIGNDDTPEFLLRGKRQIVTDATSQTVGTSNDVQDNLTLSPICAVRMPPRAAGRGLSDLVKGLRTMEEERLDEDMDILRELENGESGASPPKRTSRIEIECSQILPSIELPLGADGEQDTTDDEDHAKEGLGRDGKPLKIWKKRGQKRTTRKVNIKPTISKWKPESTWEPGKANDEDRDARNTEREENQDPGPDRIARTSKAARGATQKTSGKVVNPVAHANYRALKIKKKGNKWKGRGRFGAR